MIEIITLFVITFIWGYAIIVNTSEKKKLQKYYNKKIQECGVKGEIEEANKYIERLVRLK